MRTRLALVALLVVVAALSATPASAVGPTVGVSGGKLTITGTDETEFIEVRCDASNVYVNVNGDDLAPPGTSCSAIDQMVISSKGRGDWIDLQEMTDGEFSSLTSIAVDTGSGLDAFSGSPMDEVVNGGGDTDRFYVSGGQDTFIGDTGLDEIHLTTGDDVTLGASKLQYPGGTTSFSSVTKVVLTSDGYAVRWDARAFTGLTYLTGAGGPDVILGGRGRDWLVGGSGGDRLIGNDNGDQISGDGGRDVIRGSGGNDRLFGGPGRDDCSGGPGQDYVYADCE